MVRSYPWGENCVREGCKVINRQNCHYSINTSHSGTNVLPSRKYLILFWEVFRHSLVARELRAEKKYGNKKTLIGNMVLSKSSNFRSIKFITFVIPFYYIIPDKHRGFYENSPFAIFCKPHFFSSPFNPH
jgi:hypothetical protein